MGSRESTCITLAPALAPPPPAVLLLLLWGPPLLEGALLPATLPLLLFSFPEKLLFCSGPYELFCIKRADKGLVLLDESSEALPIEPPVIRKKNK